MAGGVNFFTHQILHSLGKELLVPYDMRLSNLRASLDVVPNNKMPDVQLIAIFWHVLFQILCQEFNELKLVPIFSKDLKFA
jgi:hypothetical protein